MNKTYKKSNINKYLDKLKEGEINELINYNGTLVDRNDNFKASSSLIRSKNTTDDFIRGATQGPEAYFIYGGPYYGINYSYTVSEGEVLEEENLSVELAHDLEAFHDIKKRKNNNIPEMQIDEMKSLVDEIIRNKKDQKGMVKKANEQGVMNDINISIPDISELKKVHEKPMVIRKMDNFLDLVHKEGLDGKEIAIVLNHIINNVGIENIDDKYKEIIGDKIKYGNEKK